MAREDREHLEELRSIHRRRLRELEKVQALKGTDTPIDISIEIEDLRAKIKSLESQLSESDVHVARPQYTLSATMRGGNPAKVEAEGFVDVHEVLVDRDDQRELFRKVLKGDSSIRGIVVHSGGERGYGKSKLLQIFINECKDHLSSVNEVFFFDPRDPIGATWHSIIKHTVEGLGVVHFKEYLRVGSMAYSREIRESLINHPSSDLQIDGAIDGNAQDNFDPRYIGGLDQFRRSVTDIFLRELHAIPHLNQIVLLVDTAEWLDSDSRSWLIELFERIVSEAIPKIILVVAGTESLFPSRKGRIEVLEVGDFDVETIMQLLLAMNLVDHTKQKLCEIYARQIFKETGGKPLDIYTFLQAALAGE